MTAKKKGTGKTKPQSKDTGATETKKNEVESSQFPVVGIGASAGGLAAFETFFSGMPAETDPGMAFVLVQHLAPDHKSLLTDLVRNFTKMQVLEVDDGMSVQPNCVYIIPPGRDMAFHGGILQLLEPAAPRGQRMPVDFFFRSLAQDLRERAIGIILSGTGSDGTLGVRAIKGEGGIVMVQTPSSTEYDGMPRSALATSLVDFELPPAEMLPQLIAYSAHILARPHKSVSVPSAPSAPHSGPGNALRKIFVLLRAQTGHDFSQYKPNTVHRRIERRMAIHQVESIDQYVKYLQRTPAEVEALFRDMLIGVTRFFRDPAVFKAVEDQIIPKLFSDKPANGVIRVWSAGCSTGEEAYSLAILLAEHLEEIKSSLTIQVFATDIDGQAIASARAGRYPASIAADISPERLKRFFTMEPDGSSYCIHKNIREMLVFSEQSAIKDPPFSRLDFISCRNLLIYMGPELQKKMIPLFHYALIPGGHLFLGTSETVGEFRNLFEALDRKAKLYVRREDPEQTSQRTSLPPMTKIDTQYPRTVHKAATSDKVSLRELTEQALLQRFAPAAALVDAAGDILYLHGRTGLYLEPAPGEAGVNNILKMAREGLQRNLAMALRKAAASREVTSSPNVRVKSNGDVTTVNVTLSPVISGHLENADEPGFLVVFEQVPSIEPVAIRSTKEGTEASPDTTDTRIAALENELRAKEEYLQATIEEMQTANEELRSSNEELQSVNEEFQSTNEELETSKEESQSINEELATVNAEMQTKVADLSRANNDMNNLLTGTGIATIFVDSQLRILRFTPTATRIINLIQSDVGRPVGHLASKLESYDTLSEDTQAVLDSLIPREVEVQTNAGAWYTLRILPYRTLENVIEGAVITFVDISAAKQAREALHHAHLRMTEAIVATVREPLLVLDTGFRIISANHAFFSAFRIAPDAVGRLLFDLDNRQWEIPALRNLLEELPSGESTASDCVVTHQFDEIGLRTLQLNARRVTTEPGKSELIFLIVDDITNRKNGGDTDDRQR